MTSQLSLGYKPAYEGRQVHERRLSVLLTTVEHLGRKEVAFELDISGSQLSDALNERDRKRWATEWTDVIKAMLRTKHDELSAKLYRQLLELDAANSDFVVDEPLDLSGEQREAVAKFIDRLLKRSR